MKNRQGISILMFAAALSAYAGSYVENANTVKQISSPGGYDSCVTNGTAWAGGIAPNLNQAKTPSNPAAAGKEFFTPADKTFRTLKDPPTDWGALSIEHPVHIAGTLQMPTAFTRQAQTFKSLSLYDGSKIPLATTAGFKNSEIWIRSGAGNPCTLSGAGLTGYIQNCQVCGYAGSGLKVCQSGSNYLVLEVDDAFKRFNGTILLSPGSNVSPDTKFRLTADFNCPGEVVARQRGFFTVKSGVTSTINLRRLELKGGCLDLTAGSYATFTNLVFTTKPYGTPTKTTFNPVSETHPVVTVLDSVSVADAAKPFPLNCTCTTDAAYRSFPLIRAKGSLNAADFTLASATNAKNPILVTTYDAATEMTTLWLKETVALTANDSGYDSSFTNSVRWTDAQVPHADADYYVPAGKILRTQKDYYDGLMEFAGRSLYLGGEFQTTTRWSSQETEKNAFAVIPELHGLAGSQWLLNCAAALSNSTLVVDAPAANPFKVNYNVNQQYGSIGLFDVTLKGAPGSMIRFASTYNKMNTVSWSGAADEFYGTINASTNYTFAVSGNLTMPGALSLAKNDVLQANGGVVSIGTLTLGDPSVTLELAATEVEGVEMPGRIVVTSALTATTPIKVSVPLTKAVRGAKVVTDLLTFPKGETVLTLDDFAITGAAPRVNATFEVVTEGDVQKLCMTRRQKGLLLFLR